MISKLQLKNQINKGNTLIETTFLTCMTIGIATAFGNGYSHTLKSVFQQKAGDPLNEFQSHRVIEKFKEINGRMIEDNRVEIDQNG